LIAAGGPACTPSTNTIESAGAPVTMISVGTAGGDFLDENQVQADKQAIAIIMNILKDHSHASVPRWERIRALSHRAETTNAIVSSPMAASSTLWHQRAVRLSMFYLL
jgi:hypothetical protein